MVKCKNIRFYGQFDRFRPKIGLLSGLNEDMKISNSDEVMIML